MIEEEEERKHEMKMGTAGEQANTCGVSSPGGPIRPNFLKKTDKDSLVIKPLRQGRDVSGATS